MARINIEDDLFKDQRWMKLVAKLGCNHKALGLLTGAWILAQKHWLRDQSIPKKAWDKDFDILLDVGLAEVQENQSIYMKGSKKAFSWLNQRSIAGKSRSAEKINALVDARKSKASIGKNTERSLNGTERLDNGSEPLYSLLSSLTLNSDTHTQESRSTKDYKYLGALQDNKTARESMEYLNNVSGKKYKTKSEHTDGMIDRLVEDGYTLDDIKKVIDVKTQQWKGTDMEKFLRPKTLFAIENFSGYLNEQEKKPFVYDIDAQIKAIKEARELDRQSKQNSN